MTAIREKALNSGSFRCRALISPTGAQVYHEIDHKVQSKNGLPYTQGEATIPVDERDYEKARKLLMKRRTSSD